MAWKTSRSCWAKPLVVSTRLGMRSLRRLSWFSTCAHCAFTASSWLDEAVVRTAAGHRRRHHHEPRRHQLPHDSSTVARARLTTTRRRHRRRSGRRRIRRTRPTSRPTTSRRPRAPIVPAAPRADAAAPAAPAPAAAATVDERQHDEQHDEEHDDPVERDRVSRRLRRLRHPDAGDGHVPIGGDALDDARGAGQQPLAVLALTEVGRHHLAAGLAGEPVGDDALEVVAHLHPHLAVVDRQQDEQAVVLALRADAAPAVLEHLRGVALHVAPRLEGLHRGDDDGVAAGRLQRPNQPVEGPGRLRVDHPGEVVHRRRELGRRRLRGGRRREPPRPAPAPRRTARPRQRPSLAPGRAAAVTTRPRAAPDARRRRDRPGRAAPHRRRWCRASLATCSTSDTVRGSRPSRSSAHGARSRPASRRPSSRASRLTSARNSGAESTTRLAMARPSPAASM